MANTCYPMSIDAPESDSGLNAVYAASATTDLVRFSPAEKQMLFKALKAVIRRFRSRIRIFSPLCSLDALIRQYGRNPSAQPSYGCRGGVDFFFVNAADGHTYPCGYRGKEDLGPLWELDRHTLNPPTDADACRQCDWECFRDPSEIFGPLLDLFSNPASLIRRVAGRSPTLATWAGDLSYYRACGFFNGRRPPDFRKLNRSSSSTVKAGRRSSPTFAHKRFNQKLSLS
jgi:hypothetical protein